LVSYPGAGAHLSLSWPADIHKSGSDV
jgi:hypothetical protein